MHLFTRSTLFLCSLLIASPSASADTLILRDDFSRASSGWTDNGRDASRSKGFATYTPSGKYQMTPTHDNTYGIMPAPRQAASGDVRIDATLFLYAGLGRGGAGVVCRYRDHDNFYGFIASGAPGWIVMKVAGGKATMLAQGRLPAGVMAGAVDAKLSAECMGDTLRLSVGGREVGRVRDTTFSTGASGLMVMGEQAAGTSATFDDVALTELAR